MIVVYYNTIRIHEITREMITRKLFIIRSVIYFWINDTEDVFPKSKFST